MRGEDEPGLRREIGLFEATVYGVGLILGAGIYAVLGEATGVTGESVVVSFLIAAVIASLTGLSYAELCSLYPKEEADYIYVREAFGSKKLSEATAVLRLLVGVISAAAVALAFAGYFSSFVDIPRIPVAVSVVAATAYVNYRGIQLSSKLNLVFTSVEVAGLVFVVWIGRSTWGDVDPLQMTNGSVGVLKSAFLIFFAYIGFGSIVSISEESKDATDTIPKAILASIGITTVLYVLVGLSAVGVVDSHVLGASDSPLAVVANQGWGPAAFTVISVIALFSTMNTVMILQISTSRLLYGVSKKEYDSFPEVFSKVHEDTRTPYVSVWSVGVMTAAFTVLGDIGVVAGLANLFLLIVFVLINLSLLSLRYRRPDIDRGFRAPLNIGRLSVTALGGVVSCILLILFYLV